MNIGTLIVLAILILISLLAIRSIVKDRKKGKGCSSCPSSSFCSGKCKIDSMLDSLDRETEARKDAGLGL